MSDFSQSGVVSTLHRLGERSTEELEAELELYSRRRPIAPRNHRRDPLERVEERAISDQDPRERPGLNGYTGK